MEAPDRAHLLAALARELADAPGEQSTTETITQRALTHVPGADGVSISLRVRRGRFVSLGATDSRTQQADELQYALGEGPCVDTSETEEWFRSGDVASDPRWPAWGPAAGDLGVRSILSVRLLGDGSPIGALNFYAWSSGRFVGRDEVDFALLYATHVAVALNSSRQVAGLETAVHSRHVIGMAQGILMERFGLDVDRSFDLLRRHSSHLNVKLHEVAQQLVLTGSIPDLPGAEPPATPTVDPQDVTQVV